MNTCRKTINNMEKIFDFEQVGKRMPYTVPDCFFDEIEENVIKEVRSEGLEVREYPKRRKTLTITICSIMAIAVAVALFFVVQPLLPKSNVDDFASVELAFNNLSTDDQDFLIQVYEDDLFINP